jgi:hypothetical protein
MITVRIRITKTNVGGLDRVGGTAKTRAPSNSPEASRVPEDRIECPTQEASMTQLRPRDGRSAVGMATVALFAAVLVAACSPAGTVPSATTSEAVATPAATIATTPNATGATPSSAPTPSPAPTPKCAVAVDRMPTTNVKFNFNGSGFAPGVDVELSVGTGPPFGGPNGQVKPKGLHTTAAGTFGPYEMFYDQNEPLGPHSISAFDGSCRATVNFTLTKS